MRFMLLLFGILGWSTSMTTHAQELSRIHYPDESLPSATPKIFAAGIITTDSIEHSAPAFSPEGSLVIWSVMTRRTYRTYLLQMEFLDGAWSKPHPPSFADADFDNGFPSFTPDGRSLIFSSTKTAGENNGVSRLWKVDRFNDRWGKAELLDTSRYKAPAYASSISANGTLFYTHGPFRTSDWNIHFSDGKTRRVEDAKGINTTAYEDGPFVSADGSYLIFESNRPGSIDGSIDLYIAVRKKDRSWSQSVPLSGLINTNASERFPRVSPDGKCFFFCRDTGNGFDVYWMHASFLKEIVRQVGK